MKALLALALSTMFFVAGCNSKTPPASEEAPEPISKEQQAANMKTLLPTSVGDTIFCTDKKLNPSVLRITSIQNGPLSFSGIRVMERTAKKIESLTADKLSTTCSETRIITDDDEGVKLSGQIVLGQYLDIRRIKNPTARRFFRRAAIMDADIKRSQTALLVTKDGTIIQLKAFGYTEFKNLGSNMVIPATDSNRYDCILKLGERHQLYDATLCPAPAK